MDTLLSGTASAPLGASAARGGAIVLISQAVKFAATFSTTIVLARLLSPSEFGLMAMALTVSGIAEVLRDFGLSTAALRQPNLTQQQHSNLFWLNVSFGAALTGLAWLSAPLIAAFYGEPELVDAVRVLSISFVISSLGSQHVVEINRHLRFFTLAIVDVGAVVVSIVTAIVLAIMGWGFWALVAQQVSLAVSRTVLAVVLAAWRPSLPRRTSGMREIVGFGASLASSQLVTYAFRNADSILLGRFYGARELGLYDRAYQLLMAPLNQLNAPLSRVAIPVLSRALDDDALFQRLIDKAQLVAIYVTSLSFFALAGLAQPVVAILLGNDWALAGPILAVLAVGGIFRALSQIAYWIFIAKGKANAFLRFQLVSQTGIILAMAAGLPWGALGVAAGHSVGFFLYWGAALWWAHRVTGVRLLRSAIESLRAMLFLGLPIYLICVACVALIPNPYASVSVAIAGMLVWFVLAMVFFRSIRVRILEVYRLVHQSLRRRRNS